MCECLREEKIIEVREGPTRWAKGTILEHAGGGAETKVIADNGVSKEESCRQTFLPHPHSKCECRKHLCWGSQGAAVTEELAFRIE